ncbi:MAG: TRAP transporter substrate-binding protein [Chitinophagales bacterium]|nr:TRAP transporter substrate-binding protein [Chitinophagales bacterium]
MKLTRKNFFKGLALGTISLPFAIRALGGKSEAQDNDSDSPNIITARKYRWKMVTTWPPNFPILQEACNLYAQLVEEMSGGRITIRVYGGNELVPSLEAFDTVRTGGAEIGSGAAYYWAGKAPAAQFFASVPFGMNAQQLNSWLLAGGGLELWEELYRDFNLVPMVGGNTGVQMGGWFNREINSIEDLKGLKMRIPGLGGKVLEKAGGAPVLLAGGEIYTGLERGVIDATEWLGPYHDTLMGFNDIAKYYYTPGWHEPGTALEYFVNKEVYDALPKDLQAILQTVTLRINHWVLSQMEAKNAEALEQLAKTDLNIRSFPKPVIDQLRIYTEEVIADITAKDPFAKKIYASYESFRQKAANYSLITEKQFYNLIQGPTTLEVG